ncbi:MAG: ABC transporter permease, partial [Acidobacteriaceae bacterium]|nr:ABC transporter permease [Acidobacteriaceae bacterium]
MDLIASLRQALRNLRKSPRFSIAAVAALAIGIGANTAIFSVINSVLLKPLPYPDSERLITVGRSYKSGWNPSMSIPKFMAWKKNTAFDSMTAYDFMGPGMNLSDREKPQQVKAIHVSYEFFRVFGVSPFTGRTFTAEEDRPGGPRLVVISHGLWKSRFGGVMTMVGSNLTLNGDPYTVIGILPAGFVSEPPADVYIPLQPDPASVNQGHYLSVTARLKSDATLAQANAQMAVLAAQFRKAFPTFIEPDEGVKLMPAQEAAVGDVKVYLLILLGAVGFVLLIACANVANLLLARAAERQKELAIRTAIGASRWHLMRQLLTESMLLGALGGGVGLILGAIGVRVLMSMVPPNLAHLSSDDGVPTAIHVFDWHVLLFTAGVALLTGLIFGLAPAWQAVRTDLNAILKESSGRSGTGLRSNKLRGVLVIAETALALVLLIGAALMIRSFVGLKSVDPGFDAHNLLTLKLSLAGKRYETSAAEENFTRQVTQRLQALPGVQSAAMMLLLPAEGSIDLPFVIEGRTLKGGEKFHGDENYGAITPRYFDVFKVRLLRGRSFTEADSGHAARVVIINEAFARKYWPNEDPVGRRMTIGGRELGPEFEEPARQIVGVVGNVRQADLSKPDQPMMYVPQPQLPDGLNALFNKVIPISWAIRTSVEPLSLSMAAQREIS